MNKQIIFIGNYLPAGEILFDKRNSQAANLFQQKIIDFIKPKLTISILPIFYNNKKVFSSRSNIVYVNNQSGCNNKLNYIYRLIYDTIVVFKILHKSQMVNILFYNIDYQNILVIIFSKYLLKKKVYILVADYPYYSNNLKSKVFNKTLKSINGVIVLNSNIKCNQNAKLLPGLLYKHEIIVQESGELNKNVILSGSLGETTGLSLALKFFSNNPQYQLYITGRIFRMDPSEFDKLIEKYETKHSNIHYLGLLEYNDYLKVIDKCDIALSLRNPDDIEHNYNFPSKILEYLSRSKMVISTINYIDIEKKIIFYSDYNIYSLKKTIDEIYMQSPSSIQQRRYNIKRYLMENFSADSINEIIAQIVY